MAENKNVKENKTISLDFDNTLQDDQHWEDGKPLGKPTEGALEFVKEMLDDGYEIVITSARVNEANDTGEVILGIVSWLEEWKFPYGLAVTGTKVSAGWYVDDKAVRFRGSWDEVRHAMSEPNWRSKDTKKPKEEEEPTRPPTIADLIRRQKEKKEELVNAIQERAKKEYNE